MADPGHLVEWEILRLLEPGQTLTVDQLVERLPYAAWNQVFIAIKVLDQQGKLVLRTRGYHHELNRAEGPVRPTDGGSPSSEKGRQEEPESQGAAKPRGWTNGRPSS